VEKFQEGGEAGPGSEGRPPQDREGQTGQPHGFSRARAEELLGGKTSIESAFGPPFLLSTPALSSSPLLFPPRSKVDVSKLCVWLSPNEEGSCYCLFVCFLLFFFSSSHTQILHIAADLRLLWVDRVRELGVGGDGGVEHIGIIDHGGLENHINENDRKASQHGLEEAVREEDGNKGARGEQIGVASVRTADNGNNSA